jgi:C4-type Zn-finger protein
MSGNCPLCRTPLIDIVTRDGCTAVPHAGQVQLRVMCHKTGCVLELIAVHSSWTWKSVMVVLNGETRKAALALLAQSMSQSM